MSPQPLILREGAPPAALKLRREVADALIQSEVATLSPTMEPDVWNVVAAGKIGVVSVGSMQVVIEPKIDINRLVFMMGFARNPTYWRDERVQLDSELDLPGALAESFRRLATRALEQGLLKGYTTVEETSAVLRGRIREADQLRRRYGRSIPLEVRYDEFTVDIPENQVLLAAAQKLLRMPMLSLQTRHGLQRLRLQLADVSLLTRGMARPDWRPSRLNTRYVPSLQLAEMILDGHSFEQRVGDVTVSGFLFSMWKIFEDFVCTALSLALKPMGGRSSLQYRSHLDNAQSVDMRPDLVWSLEGAPRLVVDAKYKAQKPAGFPQADLYQVLAYCTVLGLREGHLVYAKGEEEPHVHHVQGSPVRIHCHTLDLAQEPASLMKQVLQLSQELLNDTGVDLQPEVPVAPLS